jgi:hypothetical protein
MTFNRISSASFTPNKNPFPVPGFKVRSHWQQSPKRFWLLIKPGSDLDLIFPLS